MKQLSFALILIAVTCGAGPALAETPIPEAAPKFDAERPGLARDGQMFWVDFDALSADLCGEVPGGARSCSDGRVIPGRWEQRGSDRHRVFVINASEALRGNSY